MPQAIENLMISLLKDGVISRCFFLNGTILHWYAGEQDIMEHFNNELQNLYVWPTRSLSLRFRATKHFPERRDIGKFKDDNSCYL